MSLFRTYKGTYKVLKLKIKKYNTDLICDFENIVNIFSMILSTCTYYVKKNTHFSKTKARMYFYGSSSKSKIDWKCDRSALMKNILEARANLFLVLTEHVGAIHTIINYFITICCNSRCKIQLFYDILHYLKYSCFANNIIDYSLICIHAYKILNWFKKKLLKPLLLIDL